MSVEMLKARIADKGYKLPKRFTVRRGIWLRGYVGSTYQRPLKSRLLNDKGKMCCMGQLLRAAGAPDDALLNIESVEEAVGSCSLIGTLCSVYEANDAPGLSRDERELEVKNRVKEVLGITVLFKD